MTQTHTWVTEKLSSKILNTSVCPKCGERNLPMKVWPNPFQTYLWWAAQRLTIRLHYTTVTITQPWPLWKVNQGREKVLGVDKDSKQTGSGLYCHKSCTDCQTETSQSGEGSLLWWCSNKTRSLFWGGVVITTCSTFHSAANCAQVAND